MFNYTNMQIMNFILDKILKLLTYYTPFYHQLLQSYLVSKTVRFFGSPCRMPIEKNRTSRPNFRRSDRVDDLPSHALSHRLKLAAMLIATRRPETELLSDCWRQRTSIFTFTLYRLVYALLGTVRGKCPVQRTLSYLERRGRVP